jgi:hypothetical protein
VEVIAMKARLLALLIVSLVEGCRCASPEISAPPTLAIRPFIPFGAPPAADEILVRSAGVRAATMTTSRRDP